MQFLRGLVFFFFFFQAEHNPNKNDLVGGPWPFLLNTSPEGGPGLEVVTFS